MKKTSPRTRMLICVRRKSKALNAGRGMGLKVPLVMKKRGKVEEMWRWMGTMKEEMGGMRT
jgi:hypothetical protein